jgi:hypothetical protein
LRPRTTEVRHASTDAFCRSARVAVVDRCLRRPLYVQQDVNDRTDDQPADDNCGSRSDDGDVDLRFRARNDDGCAHRVDHDLHADEICRRQGVPAP